MCFTVTDATIKVANEDIVCFKFLDNGDKTNNAPMGLYTTYRWEPVPKDGILHPKRSMECNMDWEHPVCRQSKIYGNAIHSIKNANSIKTVDRFIHERLCVSIIPKGTKYMENNTEYISQLLIVDCHVYLKVIGHKLLGKDWVAVATNWVEEQRSVFINNKLKTK
jgi:hypothetical protein